MTATTLSFFGGAAMMALRAQVRRAERAMIQRNYVAEARSYRVALNFAALIFSFKYGFETDSPRPSRLKIVRRLFSLPKTAPDFTEVETILTREAGSLEERINLAHIALRYGNVTAIYLQDQVTGMPWQQLACDHIPSLLKQVQGMSNTLLSQYEALPFDLYTARSSLGTSYLMSGKEDLSEWMDFSRKNGPAPSPRNFEWASEIYELMHELEALRRLPENTPCQEALTNAKARVAKLKDCHTQEWALELVTSMFDETVALADGDMLSAREALLRQHACFEKVVDPILLDEISAAIVGKTLMYVSYTKRSDLVFLEAARLLVLHKRSSNRLDGSLGTGFGYLALWAQNAQRLWVSCLFLKISSSYYQRRKELAKSAAFYVDQITDDELFVFGELAKDLVSLGRFSEAAEAVELDLVRGNSQMLASVTGYEAQAIETLEHAVEEADADDESLRKLASVIASVADSLDTIGRARDNAVTELNAAIRARKVATLPAEISSVTAALHYVVSGSGVLVLLQAGGQEVAVPLSVAAGSEINSLVFETLRAVSNPNRDPRAELQRAYDTLFAPLAKHLSEVNRLLIAAPGVLHALPWAALHNGQQYIAERWTIVRATAPGINMREPPCTNSRMVSCGVARAGSGLPPLGYAAAAEAEAVASTFPGSLLVDGSLTRPALVQALGYATMLHVVSHFEPSLSGLDNSCLLLGDGTMITLAELASFDLARLDLLTLSTCSSGVVDSVTSAEVAFAADAILLAGGARAVVSTLWSVDNAATCDFMTAFYTHLRAGLDKDIALARA